MPLWRSSGAAASVSSGATFTGGTQGSVIFLGASGAWAQDNANLFWDDTNNRLGIGTATPSNTLHVKGTARVETTVDSSTELLRFQSPSWYGWLGLNNGLFNIIAQGSLNFGTNGTSRWQINSSGHWIPGDNLLDLGASASRVRSGYFGTSVITPAVIASGNLTLQGSASGLFFFTATAQVTLAPDATTYLAGGSTYFRSSKAATFDFVGNRTAASTDPVFRFIAEVGSLSAGTLASFGDYPAGAFQERFAVTWEGALKGGSMSYIDFPEISAPSAPSANRGRMYFKDNGLASPNNRTQLVVKWSDGTETVVAESPAA